MAIDTGLLMHIFDRTTECYKLFWFKVILSRLKDGITTMSYEEIVDEMIASAWYMVSEYHLKLGPDDGLENLIKRLQPQSGLRSTEEKNRLLKYIRECSDPGLKKEKARIIRYVPYCLQSPFFPPKVNLSSYSGTGAIGLMNENKGIIYTYSAYRGLDTKITVNPEWTVYLRENCTLVSSWIDYNLINYLQRKNPSVPGIPNKLTPPEKRNLGDISKYWKAIITISPVREIYTGTTLTSSDLSIDHFVPWSYCASDEFWNLHPTTKSINSSKSNNLPVWDRYFPSLVDLEYLSYSLIHRYPSVHDVFESVREDHFSSPGIRERLYERKGLSRIEFGSVLSDVLEPQYRGAENTGFKKWII